MTKLFGKTWTKDEILAYVGDVSALGGIRLVELADGPGRGVRVADVRTGAGFHFTVLVDRGMDIGFAAFNGTPIAFQASAGVRSPHFYEPEGYGWLQTFHGGLLCLCGLSAAGHPSEDAFGGHGLHGRVSNTPAQFLSLGDGWDGDEYEFWVSGRVRESVVFGFNLQMTRKITVRLGENRLYVDDAFENLGCEPAPLMLLYHCNFGFPLVAEGSELIVDDVSVIPRDAEAEKGIASHHLFEVPQAGYVEQVFYHKARADEEGYVTAAIVNRWLNEGEGVGGLHPVPAGRAAGVDRVEADGRRGLYRRGGTGQLLPRGARSRGGAGHAEGLGPRRGGGDETRDRRGGQGGRDRKARQPDPGVDRVCQSQIWSCAVRSRRARAVRRRPG
jgi:hypothetical protein